MEKKTWELTQKRFVAFFDIMGFKSIVERNSHSHVLQKLTSLKETTKWLTEAHTTKAFESIKEKFSESKAITFSDSIIIFSKSDTLEDACKILMDSFYIIDVAIKNKIGIKGAISYGNITVDFDNSLFFGQPIIDAYLLHDQLNLYTAVLDNSFESKIAEYTIEHPFKILFTLYKTPLKTGKVSHKVIRPDTPKRIEDQVISLKKMYETVSGSPRIYIDNTIEFLEQLK